MQPTRPFDLVIFDMDGTIIEQMLDFQAIRERLGVAPGQDIIKFIEAMDPPERREAAEWLEQTELRAVEEARLTPGAAETLDAIKAAGIKTALLTRNTRESMEKVIERFGLEFDLAWSREAGPIKPEPDGVLKACGALGAETSRTACVGDFRYDVVAANAAGAISILMAPPDTERPDFADLADHVIGELSELLRLLRI